MAKSLNSGVKKILISQPKPAEGEKSPYLELCEKFKCQSTFRKFIKIEGVPAREFRKTRISLLEHGVVIMTSRNAVDHYFRMAKEMRIEIPTNMKYVCTSETTAFYIQNYVQYRKRKIFFTKQQSVPELMELLKRHKDDLMLFPCSNLCKQDIPMALEKEGYKYTKANIYRTVADTLNDEIAIDDYDLIVFFSPIGIQSLQMNFPDFKQGKCKIAGFGTSTCQAIEKAGFRLDVKAPQPGCPSMVTALDAFLSELAKAKK